MKGSRLLVAAAILFVLYFVVEGGEYGTSDIVTQRARRDSLDRLVRGLRAEVRDLRVQKRLVETDPATQERIAREEFGMVRGDRELLYRLLPPSDSGGAADSAGAPARP